MRLPEGLRRPDWLKELQAVLIIGLAVVGAFGVVGAVRVLTVDSLELEVPGSAVAATADHSLREGVTVAPEQGLVVAVTDPSVEQRISWVLARLPTYGVLVAQLVLLLWLVWHARRHDPFTLATVRRLRVLAAVTLVGGYCGFLLELFAALHLSSTVLVDGIVTYTDVPLAWFLVGFGLLAVAEVVKRGCVMRAELETVV